MIYNQESIYKSTVSVIIPTYNRAKVLPEAIDSVLKQTHPVLEIIVVDDGSTDNTKEVCEQYQNITTLQPVVRYIYQQNQGVSAARNTGIHASQAEYLIFLDSDDLLLPETVEIGLHHITSRPETGFVFGHYNFMYINPDGSYTLDKSFDHPPPVASYETILAHQHNVFCSCAIVRRNVAQVVGGFNPKLKAGEVTDFFLRIAREFPLYFHNQVVFDYRYNGNNVSGNAAEMLLSTLYVNNLQWNYIQKTGKKEYIDACKRGKEALLTLFIPRIPYQINKYLNSGNWVAALGLLRLISTYDPKLQFIDKDVYALSYQATISQIQQLPIQSSLDYWQKQLADITPLLSLPSDRPRPAEPTFQGNYESFTISEEITTALNLFSTEQQVTLSTTLLTAFYTLLYRYTDTEDIIIASPLINPDAIAIEGFTSFFVNAVPFRTDLSGNPTFIELLERVNKVKEQAQIHQDLPWEILIDTLQVKSDANYSPLFQVMFYLEEDISLQKVELATMTASPWVIQDNTTKFDLTLFLEQTTTGITGKWLYSSELFDAATITRMNGHFQTLVNGILYNPESTIAQLPLLTASEKQQLLVDWNNTVINDQPDKCIHQLFEEQVEQNPNKIAVVFEHQKLTYQELNQQANQLAYYLQTLGVSPDVLVGMYIEPCLEIVIAKLAILKAGGAYIAILPEYNQEEVDFILTTARVPLLLTQEQYREKLSQEKVLQVYLDTDWEKIAQEKVTNPQSQVTARNLIYGIFTPNGAALSPGMVIEHQQVLNYLQGIQQQHPSSRAGNYAIYSHFAADVGNTLLFRCLSQGGCFHILSQERLRDSHAFLEYCQTHPIDYLKIFPSDLSVFLSSAHPETILPRQALIFAGEVTNWDLIEKIREYAPNCQIFNRYVPKETTIGVVIYRIDHPEDTHLTPVVPWGRPLPNIQIYLLDKYLQPVPIGVTGEIYIGGVGVARGYLDNVDGQEKNFIPHPFGDQPNARLYKTGDLARYLPDGNIEYNCNIENRVKIRNLSHSFGEIETIMNTQARISSIVLPDPRIVLLEPEQEPITQIFTAWASKSPEHPAIIQDVHNWSYAQLATAAQEIAQILHSHKVEKGDTVAISGFRSFGLIASMLGVLMSGSVLVNIDPNLPEARQKLMLTTAKTKYLLYVGNNPSAIDLRESVLDIITIHPHTGKTTGSEHTWDGEYIPVTLFPDDSAYIFFTSGTTGTPKGVLGCHKGLSHFLNWQRQTFKITPQDRAAQLTGLSFDVILRDIFLPLTSGATLCLPSLEDDLTPGRILPWMEHQQISLLHTVPTLAQSWLMDVPQGVSLSSLRCVFFAGEPLTQGLIQQWRSAFPETKEIINLYGPTETTLAKFYYRVPSENMLSGVQPVGSPLPETQGLVLTPDHQLCQIGEFGEIVIRTPFRSKGYINGSPENLSKFVKNPWRDDDTDLLYYTGDRGRYSPDGKLEILGRIDDQVKIRGIRIEPGEISSVLNQHPLIKTSIVIAREDQPGDKKLVAYFVTNSQKTSLNSELRQFLKQKLADYMIPAAFVRLESLPMTANGKIDRRALPAPEIYWQDVEKSVINPRNQIEIQLTKIWEKILGISPISINDNFFELGGHSLLALRLFAEIDKTFGKTLSLATLFQKQTIEEMATLLASTVESSAWKSLVMIQQGQPNKTPLFCIHAIWGNVLFYQKLARYLEPDQPFYALQAQGLDGKKPPLTSIPEMASVYIQEIQAIQPQGPYYLGGFSLGAVVALEIAQQLHKQGQKVEFLAFFDANPFLLNQERIVNNPSKSHPLLSAVRSHIKKLMNLGLKEQINYIWERIYWHLQVGKLSIFYKSYLQYIKRSLSDIYILEVAYSNYQARNKYVPQDYPGKVTFLLASDHIKSQKNNSQTLRHQSVNDQWETYIISDTTHTTIMEEPQVKLLAEKLTSCLHKAQKNISQKTKSLVN